jgi:hypothetical protein
MKVAVDMLEPVREPYLRVYPQHLVRMLLRPGSVEVGRRRSAMRRVTYSGGEVGLCCRHMEQWLGSSDLHLLSLGISDAALNATCDGTSGGVELRWAIAHDYPNPRELPGTALNPDGRMHQSYLTKVKFLEPLRFTGSTCFLSCCHPAGAPAGYCAGGLAFFRNVCQEDG